MLFRSDAHGITLNDEPSCVRNSYWMVTAILDPALKTEKEIVIDEMAKRKIDCRPFFYPLSSLPAYAETAEAKRAQERNHVAYRLSPYGVNLPSALNLTRDQVRRVCQSLKEILPCRVASVRCL